MCCCFCFGSPKFRVLHVAITFAIMNACYFAGSVLALILIRIAEDCIMQQAVDGARKKFSTYFRPVCDQNCACELDLKISLTQYCVNEEFKMYGLDKTRSLDIALAVFSGISVFTGIALFLAARMDKLRVCMVWLGWLLVSFIVILVLLILSLTFSVDLYTNYIEISRHSLRAAFANRYTRTLNYRIIVKAYNISKPLNLTDVAATKNSALNAPDMLTNHILNCIYAFHIIVIIIFTARSLLSGYFVFMFARGPQDRFENYFVSNVTPPKNGKSDVATQAMRIPEEPLESSSLPARFTKDAYTLT